MSSDVDFEQFIKLLDGALASDDKTVRQALRKFLFVAAMVLGDDCEPGPFTKMMETMDEMQKRLHDLENKTATTTDSFPQWPAPGSPYWGGGSAAGPYITYTNNGTSSGSTNATSTTTVGGTSTTTGNITLSGGTASTYITPPTTTTPYTTTFAYTLPKADKSGTEIKDGIMEALDRLANVV